MAKSVVEHPDLWALVFLGIALSGGFILTSQLVRIMDLNSAILLGSIWSSFWGGLSGLALMTGIIMKHAGEK